MYCSVPTSPGGGYRSALGRLFFRTKEMIQTVEAPDTVRNKVVFSVMGFLDGEVSLKGRFLSIFFCSLIVERETGLVNYKTYLSLCVRLHVQESLTLWMRNGFKLHLNHLN